MKDDTKQTARRDIELRHYIAGREVTAEAFAGALAGALVGATDDELEALHDRAPAAVEAEMRRRWRPAGPRRRWATVDRGW